MMTDRMKKYSDEIKRKIKIIISTIFMLMILCLQSRAQDCKGHFEVNAGPDIDVCEGGTVQLHGIIGGDATKAAWRGGKGTFTPGRFSVETEYTPSEEEKSSGLVLTLVASNPDMKDCPPAR